MNPINKYIEYLKDNPERYWFKRKLFGYGWTPATKEGWLVTLIYIAVVIGYVVVLEARSEHIDPVIEIVFPIALSVLVFISICYKTGEPPKWQWGIPKDKEGKNEDKDKMY